MEKVQIILRRDSGPYNSLLCGHCFSNMTTDILATDRVPQKCPVCGVELDWKELVYRVCKEIQGRKEEI